jgi:hypothetical protein
MHYGDGGGIPSFVGGGIPHFVGGGSPPLAGGGVFPSPFGHVGDCGGRSRSSLSSGSEPYHYPVGSS